MAQALAAEVGSSHLCTRGEPAMLTIEYFTDNLKAAMGDQEVTILIMTDLNPSGVSIRKNLVAGIEAQGVKVAKVVQLLFTKDFSDDVLPGSKAKVVRFEIKGTEIIPVPPSGIAQVTKALRWFESIGDPRLRTETEYPGGNLVVTIWGIDSDTADREMVRKRFLDGVSACSQKPKKSRRWTSSPGNGTDNLAEPFPTDFSVKGDMGIRHKPRRAD